MRYECPSCKMAWSDLMKPIEMLSMPLCIFCSCRHTEKELLNWQMDHLKEIPSKHFPVVLRNFYRYVEGKLNIIEERLHDKQEKDPSIRKCTCKD